MHRRSEKSTPVRTWRRRFLKPQAMLLAANFLFVMTNDPTPLAQARRGVENVLARLVVSPEPKKKRSTRGKP